MGSTPTKTHPKQTHITKCHIVLHLIPFSLINHVLHSVFFPSINHVLHSVFFPQHQSCFTFNFFPSINHISSNQITFTHLQCLVQSIKKSTVTFSLFGLPTNHFIQFNFIYLFVCLFVCLLFNIFGKKSQSFNGNQNLKIRFSHLEIYCNKNITSSFFLTSQHLQKVSCLQN